MAESDQGEGKRERDDEPGRPGRRWIDIAVRVAPYFFLDPVRLRWRLENWRLHRAQARRRREQKFDHIRYQHKTCAACGAIQDRGASACTRCGEKLGHRGFQVLHRLGVFAPEWISMSSLLGLALVLAFARLLLAAPGGMKDLFGFDVGLLVHYGGNLSGAVAAGESWRLLTACFLHGGLLHIGFNLFALNVIGPQVESLYGRLTMLLFFVVTGVLANLGSGLAGLPGVGIGASGGLMGLVGVAAGWGQRQGTTVGHQLRNDMIKWSLYVIVFGLLIPNTDNWAHVFGLATGFACGFAIRPQLWRRPAMAPIRTLACSAAVAATLAALFLIVRPPASSVEGLQQGTREDWFAGWTEVCRLHDRGDRDAALARAAPLFDRLRATGKLDPSVVIGPADIASICTAMTDLRRSSEPVDRR